MATAKLMASPNSDLKRRSSSSSSTKSSLSDLEIQRQNSINTTTANGSTSLPLFTAAPAPERRSVEEVWREIVAGRMEKCKEEMKEEERVGEMMTLEDFLAKAEAKKEVKVEMERMVSGGGSGVLGFGMEEIGRGKRKGVVGFEVDKAAQQRQRRMIKNRESAARSRERKQAYQAELESMAVKLEEENELLLKEKAERTKGRFKQLMEKVIPVVEKRRPQLVLKRVRSAHW